ncbi:OLC1v1007983C1 [Oldenlandia corymbosa var. corymbosa]|uniref:OLC1v1007979C1 n=1 Tax=Oldenlandia corymbosa var. corymbosa TaxID=529605 RepID=A0AAV1DMZ3_OLDCO|nr:OLC1v1007979C1 [Oldenlandia corymbosa var. corymbosa]CAI9108401.1 OLC1v1007983C1 [Oldenlandia corymbosa var. corymbosa]
MEVGFAATISPSSVASSQKEFWSKNVVNAMPEAFASKLSPLSNQASRMNSLLASSTANKESSNMNGFCSVANLACTPLPKTTLQVIKETIVLSAYGASPDNMNSHVDDDDGQSLEPNFFFRLSSVFQNGKRIRLPNLDKISLPPRSFLPSQIASKISTKNSSNLQKYFPTLFSSSSMKDTLERSTRYCNMPALKGEIRSCSNSLEEMIEFSKKALGVTKLVSLSTLSSKGSGKELEIGNIKQFHAQKVVSCHEVFFPFATYFCHSLISSKTRLYAVDFVEPENKTHVNRILAVCHMDTSAWPSESIALKALKISPGKGEACHWYRKDDPLWIGSDGANKKL